MKNEFKYRVRRLIMAIILLMIFMTFTISVLVKGIDNEIARRDRVLSEHNKIWEVTEWTMDTDWQMRTSDKKLKK